MYLNCLVTSILFSLTFCRKYYLLETEEKRETLGITTPSTSKDVSIRPRSVAVLKSPGKIRTEIKDDKFSPKVKYTVVTTKLLPVGSVRGIFMLKYIMGRIGAMETAHGKLADALSNKKVKLDLLLTQPHSNLT